MLSAFADTEDMHIKIQFDMPVPQSVCQNGEFFHLLKEIGKSVRSSACYNEKRELTALVCDTEWLYDFIERNLSPQEASFQKKFFEELLKQKLVDQGTGLSVNFHQRSFDIPERCWDFIINQRSFIDYFFNRLNWCLGPKKRVVTSFPLHVDLETASTCNMNCPMCYRDQMKESGQMEFDVFKKVVDECADNNVFSVRLSWRGEALTHPRIKEMIAYATGRIKNVSLLTNAFYINEDMADCFIENGLSYIAVSFDGTGEIYESIRHPAKFRENYERLAMLRDKKDKAGSKLPQVRLCTIWPAIENDPEEYYRTMKDVSDYIVCNPFINFRGPMKIKTDFICQYPWERMVISHDGKAQCCTGWNVDDIILGNVQYQSLKEMWRGDLMTRVRKLHSEGKRMELSSCAECRHGTESDGQIGIKEIIERKY